MNQHSTAWPAGRSSVAPLDPMRMRIAFVSSSWHGEIVAVAREAALNELQHGDLPPPDVDHFEVPGAFEIPLHAKKLAQTGRYDAIIACALVVNGGIYRHEFVAAAVIDGLMRVQIESEVPILSAVLTPRDFHEHEDHHRFFREHFVKKGIEVARACLQTVAGLEAIQGLKGLQALQLSAALDAPGDVALAPRTA